MKPLVTRHSSLVAAIAAAAAIATTGCDKETRLNSNLEETQANLIVAALLDAGISAHKSPGDEGAWNVMVAESRFAEAANLLEKKGLPRRAYNGVGEVFKKSGMVSSPSEERIRFMDALAQDLARTIAGIDGVLDARVHIVLPENDPFARNALPSSAAVAIRALSELQGRHSPSAAEMVELQYEVMNLSFQQEVVTKVADKSSNAVQTLIKNQ